MLHTKEDREGDRRRDAQRDGQPTVQAPGDDVRRPRQGLLHSSWARAGGLALAAAALTIVAFGSIAYGSRSLPLGTVLDAFFAYEDSTEHLIVRRLRVPRTMLGLGVGAALGLAGGVMQGLTRNPLADPGILGVEAGAALAVVVGIHTFGIGSLTGYVWFAFAGAALASAVVYGIGSLGRGGAAPVKLALAGAATSALLASFTYAILILDAATLDQYRFWAVGSLAGRDGTITAQVAPFLVAGVLLALLVGRALNALALGDDVARALGQRVWAARAASALAVVVLTGAATAAAGPIGFVGLAIPHVARAICGSDYRWILPWSAVLGPVLLLGADVLGRMIVRPAELQVGVITPLVGVPFFIALVRRRRLAEL